MKLNDRRQSRSKRRWAVSGTPVEVETFESRVLLTTVPNLLTPTGDISTPNPEFTWEAVDNAASYDLWVTSLVSYETLFVARDIADTRFTPAEGSLSLGDIRVWVRANLVDGGNSAWSPSQDLTVTAPPTITGPVGVGANNVTTDNMPLITWDSSLLAERFQIWVTDLTQKAAAEAAAGTDPVDVSLHSTVYTVLNHAPVTDADGNPTTDASGNVITQEVRSFQLPVDPNPNSTSTELLQLPISRYRIWMRSIDDTGSSSAWGAGFTFDVGPQPENLSPTAPTFQQSPNLLFDAVDGATHYEVYVGKEGMAGPFFRRVVATTSASRESVRIVQSVAGTPIVENSNDIVEATEMARLDQDGQEIPFIIPQGKYTFWVRAISNPTDGPIVNGIWSSGAQFETLTAPTITAPVPADGVVTAARPTVTWTPIDGAARYEVLVNRFNARPPFLEATSITTSYTFAEDIPRGDYTVWVRPVSTRGDFGPWSAAKQFTATGGRPVITAPAPGSTLLFPSFEWTPVTDADVVGYDIWVSFVGVDFTFINIRVTETSFAGSDPLNDGDYRVWIRAVKADGTTGLWSDPVDFVGGVAALENEGEASDVLLADIGVELNPVDESISAAERTPVHYSAAVPESVEAPSEDNVLVVDRAESTDDGKLDSLTVESLPETLLTRLAQQCVDSEWWEQTADVS